MLSPLCSGLVIPGLGQVINEQLKKAFCMLAIVFVFILALSFELYQLTRTVLKSGLSNIQRPETLMDRIMAQDLTTLVLLVAGFAVLWIYSIFDALIGGIKADHSEAVQTRKES